MSAAGRRCPLDYRYAPEVLARPAELEAETLYVIGGLYGNRPALEAVLTLAENEPRPVTLVFNGDFNWFNVDLQGFRSINETVLKHHALRGNVETELAREAAADGCGCAYPDWVDDAAVARSNAIMRCLRETARRCPELRKRLSALPMHGVAQVGGLRIGIVHGDAESLAGWRFSHESLADPAQWDKVQDFFNQAQVRIFASSHTCLLVIRGFQLSQGDAYVVNNGAAGLPNFHDSPYGVLTRIATRPAPQAALYGVRVDGVYVDAVAVPYDHQIWQQDFLALWPPGSAAYDSYFDRIMQGPDFDKTQALIQT